ncbi:MAG: hypothetical protein NZ930_03855 [Candidatus Bipolaricaulota bacterium]|nr:hypothetical protein [Candidatus Bipolaricaulota bacterium]MDW8031415.1 hypothetical protein [Candidatus Bipolaricaulota bacterium]
MNKKALTLIVLLLVDSTIGYGRIVGNWTTSVSVQPQMPSVIDQTLVSSSSTLILRLFLGDLAQSPSRALSRLFLTDPSFTQLGFALQMIWRAPALLQGFESSLLHFQGYSKQQIIMEYPVGTLLWRFAAAFSSGGLRYFWNQAAINYGGVAMSSELLLLSTQVGVLAGLSLSFKGNTFEGAAAGINLLLGTETDLTSPGFGTEGNLSEWNRIDLTIEGASFLEWVHCDSITRFTRTNGFEYSRWDFYYEPDTGPLSLLLTLRVLPDEETTALTALLDLDGPALYLYTNFQSLRGLSLQYIELMNDWYLSSTVALEGKLYKRTGASDIDLRARDYLIDTALKDPISNYEQTDYDAVVSLEGMSDGALTIAGDLYFRKGEAMPALLTSRVNFDIGLSKNLAFSSGIALDPRAGLKLLILGVEVWFHAY